MVSAEVAVPSCNDKILRPLADFPEDIWGDRFDCFIVDKQFKNANGQFNQSHSSDIKGLLSLYEAAQVRTQKDKILEEALAFATTNLKWGALHAGQSLAKQVKYALKQAIHKCIPRIEARHYISVYEEDESRNPLVLKLAKLDYNLLQMLYKQELSEIIRWGNESEIVSKLPYSRARLVESYLFGLGMFFKPQHSLGRIISAKTTALITAIDDTYDSYGTLDELKTFTDAIERWDASEIDRLSTCMKTSYMSLLNVSDGVDNALTGQHRSYAADKYKEEHEKQYSGTGIECYMKHYNVSEQEAKKPFADIVEDAWKDINEKVLKLTTISREILVRFLNLARIVNVFYIEGVDGFTNPHNVLEPHIKALLVDPIIV